MFSSLRFNGTDLLQRSFWLTLVFGIFLLPCTLVGCKREPEISSCQVQWMSKDGVDLHATLYEKTQSTQSSSPGLILLHSVNESRAIWVGAAERFVDLGFVVLAVDLRGHGESTTKSGQVYSENTFNHSDWQSSIHDIALAKEALLTAGANPDNLFILGSGLGANIGFKYAHTDSAIQGMILLSPGLEYNTISIEQSMSENRRLPVLFLATNGDSYSAGSVEKLKVLTPAYAESRLYPGTAHGIDLLNGNSKVMGDIQNWLDPIVQK